MRIDSFSSHADEPHLLEWVKKTDPGVRVFINHGDDEVTDHFAAEVSKAIGKPAVAPYSGEEWNLATDELVRKAEIKPVVKKQAQGGSGGGSDHRDTKNASPEYKNLKTSADELMKLVGRSGEISNKELRKMQSDIEELIKKYQ